MKIEIKNFGEYDEVYKRNEKGLIFLHKVYYESDNNGRYKILEKKNGVKIKLLKEPSESYKKKIKKQYENNLKKQKHKEEINNIKQKIENKKKEIAISELLKEGKITKDELKKIEE